MAMIEVVRIFVKVVQRGSFSRAAEALRLPKSTVSRVVSRLEEESGSRLLVRTTRSLTPTAAGLALYESSAAAVQALEDAMRSIHGHDDVIAGHLKLTAPEDLGAHVISPLVAKLSREHPELTFELDYTDELVDLVRDGYDLAIRLGKLPPTRFKSKFLGMNFVVPVAAPAYLEGAARIVAPGDLADHACLAYRPESANPKWTLQSGRKLVHVAIRPKVVVNMMTSLLQLARSGAGVAFIPNYLCREPLATGELVRVLPGWSEPGLPVHTVSPLGSGASSRLRLISTQLNAGIERALR